MSAFSPINPTSNPFIALDWALEEDSALRFQDEKENLFQKASVMDEEVILILKQNYLKIGHDLLEMLEYLDSVAEDASAYLSVAAFMEGLCNTDLLKEGLRLAIETNPQMAHKISEEISEWDLSYDEIEALLSLIDDKYGYLLNKEEKGENHGEDKESLRMIINKLTQYLRDEKLSVPELKYFSVPRKRIRF